MRHIKGKVDSESPLFILNPHATLIPLSPYIFPIQRVTLGVGEDVVHLSRVLYVRVRSNHIFTVAALGVIQSAAAVYFYFASLALLEPVRLRWTRVELNATFDWWIHRVTRISLVKHLVIENYLGCWDTSGFILSTLVCKTTCAVATVLSVVFQVGTRCVLDSGLPPKLGPILCLVCFHAALDVVITIRLVLVPAEVVDGALFIFKALLLLDSVLGADWLIRPIVQHVAVGASSAVGMLVAADIDGFSLALAVVADWALAFIVEFAVTARILILSHRHRLLAQSLLLFCFDLRCIIIYARKKEIWSNLKQHLHFLLSSAPICTWRYSLTHAYSSSASEKGQK